MKDFLVMLNAELNGLLDMRADFSKQLKHLPKGSLSATVKGGKVYYSKIYNKKKRYVGKEDNIEVVLLQKKYYLEESIRRINTNLDCLEKIIAKWKSVMPVDVLAAAPKAYSGFSGINSVLCHNQKLIDWEQHHYCRSQIYPEGLIHRTIKGEYVRSKSEALIANSLSSHGIPYHYEEIRMVAEEKFAPDFTIFVAKQNRIIIWEHFGMISDATYLQRCVEKIARYLAAGYKLWEDLIITFDALDNSIDTQLIDNIINTFLK